MRLVLYLPLFLVAFFTVYASADEQQQLGLENRFRRARDATMDWIASHNLKMPFGKTKREAVATETDKKADKQEQTTNEKAATSPTKKAKSPKKEAPETKLPVTTVGRRWRATTIGIGTPAQEFNVIVSTSYAYLWVMGQDAGNTQLNNSQSQQEPPVAKSGRGGCCGGHAHDTKTTAPPSLPDIRRYDSSKSKTAQMSSPAEPVTFVGDGCGCIRDTVEGYLIKDTVTIGGKTFPEVELGVVSSVDERFLQKTANFTRPVEGRLGLGLPLTGEFAQVTADNARRRVPPPMESIVDIGYHAHPLVTFYQKKSTYAWNDEHDGLLDGSLTVGGENAEKCGSDFTWLHYTADNETTPGFRLRSLGLSGSSGGSGNKAGFDVKITQPRYLSITSVVIDDELDLMLRYGESDKIAAELGAVRTEAARGHAHYTIDCAKRGSVPSLRIELEDARDVQKNLVLELDEYIINEDADHCRLMVVGFAADENDNRPAFFGNGLFQGRCYAINMRDKTVGFAKAQNGKEKEN